MSPRGRRRDPPPAPFVVGVGRSGTTLLRLMLDAHPELAIPPETQFLPELIERGGDPEVVFGARTWPDFGLDETTLRARIGATREPGDVARAFYGLYAEREGKPRWGEKTPAYVRRMTAIAAELPEARFIHLIRDGRDVALSRRRRGMGEGKPMAETARLWKRRIEDARKQSRRLRGAYAELRYEDLVAGPEDGLRTVCELCELSFDRSMLSFHERSGQRLAELGDLEAEGVRSARRGDERLAAHSLAREPATTARIGAWRDSMSAADRSEFEAVAGDLLRELGYDA